MRYLLNAPILTAYGDFRFEGPLPLGAARAFVRQDLRSAIGHESTARLLSRLLGVDVPCRREAVRMQPGDQALVFRLPGRQSEAAVLDERALEAAEHEFGLLTRLS
jgi:hypothetical protein